MAIYVKTNNPQGLLDEIRKSIENNVVQTWSVDNDGDFTHVSQWKNKAWLNPQIQNGRLAFGLIGRKDEPMSKLIYGIYHGRFSEMLLTHFDSSIEDIQLTPKGIEGLDSFQ